MADMFNNINVEKMTDAERRDFQSKNHVLIIGRNFGHVYEDFRDSYRALIDFLDLRQNPAAVSYRRRMDDNQTEIFGSFLKQIQQGGLRELYSRGFPIVIPDPAYFNNEYAKDNSPEALNKQTDVYANTIAVATILNKEIARRHNVAIELDK